MTSRLNGLAAKAGEPGCCGARGFADGKRKFAPVPLPRN